MSQIIIICDTAEWFRLVLLLWMHFCVIFYVLLMGTKICIRKYTFTQIADITGVLKYLELLLLWFLFFSIVIVLSFWLLKQFSSIILFIITITFYHCYYHLCDFYRIPLIQSLYFSSSILLSMFPPFHTLKHSCIAFFFFFSLPFYIFLTVLDHFC